jgi:hypothetical protein
MRFEAAILVASVVWSAPIAAQSQPDTAANDTAPVHNVFIARTAMSLLGWFPGAFAGGYIGSVVPHGPCGCDDPGLKEVLTGIAVGGAFGSALAAAAPKLNSRCSFAERFGLGLLGSAVGLGIGMIRITDGSVALTVPVFSIAGASIAERWC